ncbi:MAG: hypothetical protein WDW36_001174 [Sanguina aurantia]
MLVGGARTTLTDAPALLSASFQTQSLSPISFTSRGSVACRKLISRRAQSVSIIRAAPFASLSMAAMSVTASPAKGGLTSVGKPKKTVGEILQGAGKKALQGGLPGMAAMALQVLTLMWLRTTINYQYRFGTSTMVALTTLWKDGGIPRFYSGLGPALIQGPLSRFGDTAANTGALALLEDVDMPIMAKTFIASLTAGAFRIFLMPVDALKTILQVEGKNGIPALMSKIKVGGPSVLYHGALAAWLATVVGHYPWFAMYNTLNESLPKYDELKPKLLRAAFIGFCSSFVSDCCSNSIRVLKTAKQTSTVPVGYIEIAKTVIAKDGVIGLFGRGLGTKLITNGIQGILFSVLWRLGQDYMIQQEAEKKLAEDAVSAGAAAAAAAGPGKGGKK